MNALRRPEAGPPIDTRDRMATLMDYHAGGPMQRIMNDQDMETIFSADLVVLYKHSPT